MAPRLRVLAGTSPDTMVPITHIVNTGTSHHISTSLFEGEIAAYIKGFSPRGEESEYFRREDRAGVTWSIQVKGVSLEYDSPILREIGAKCCWHLLSSPFGFLTIYATEANCYSLGRFLMPHSADDILFGNTFDRPLKLPWGTSAVLKFMKFVLLISFQLFLKY